jgi:hypothetical protein
MAIPQVDFAPDKEGKKVPVLDEFPPPHERGPGDGIIDQNRVFHAGVFTRDASQRRWHYTTLAKPRRDLVS